MERDRREVLLGWLDAVRAEGYAAPGRHVEQVRQVVGLILSLAGFLAGTGLVGGWLALTLEPVNVLYFWAVTTGLPAVTLVLWCIAVLPKAWMRRLPGLGSLSALLRWLGQALPAAAARVSGLWRFRSGPREEWLAFWDRIRRLDWVYRPVRFWLAVELTQRLVLAFSLGAVSAFVALSYGTDPSFGWRSTLLDAPEVHAATRVISAPWAWAWPEAALTLEEVRDTRYSSLEPRYAPTVRPPGGTHPAGQNGVWAAWWPFLFASMLVYALLPRLVTNGFSRWRARRAVSRSPLDHADFQQLRERLRRPPVDTRSPVPEDRGPVEAPETSPARSALPLEGTCLAVRWEGVDLSESEIRRLVGERLGTEVRRVFTAGGLDPEPDAQLIGTLARESNGDPVVLIVEAWEPPAGDYLDFLRDLRRSLGKGRIISVLLFDRDGEGRLAAPSADRDRPWRHRIGGIGDPWVRVTSLIEEGDA